jgi:hypothetical protein
MGINDPAEVVCLFTTGGGRLLQCSLAMRRNLIFQLQPLSAQIRENTYCLSRCQPRGRARWLVKTQMASINFARGFVIRSHI